MAYSHTEMTAQLREPMQVKETEATELAAEKKISRSAYKLQKIKLPNWRRKRKISRSACRLKKKRHPTHRPRSLMSRVWRNQRIMNKFAKQILPCVSMSLC